jgi:dTDP-4-amino-4,6-dideoxygalactose transaminase
MIPVTEPFLPAKEDYQKYIDGIWSRVWLTNNGPLVNELELKLKEYLALDHLLFLSNGTIAIQIAIKALGLRGKIITTPFSYVATTSSIFWENCEPVFVDIDAETLNIDTTKVEAAIDKDTSAILATHCFGNTCGIEALEQIAAKHNLKLIFDAAHCFGTTYKGKSVFAYGDVSTTSFHSTKLFHTIEGGAVVTNSPDILKRMAYMRNFGHDGPEKFNGVGINGKNSEFHAAMGLCNLRHIDEILSKRKEQSLYYQHVLRNLAVTYIKIEEHCVFNYAYFPVIFASEELALKAKAALEREEIFPRRYFSPSLSSLDYVTKRPTPVSDSVASRILCLPLYHRLSQEEQDMIARILLRAQNYL